MPDTTTRSKRSATAIWLRSVGLRVALLLLMLISAPVSRATMLELNVHADGQPLRLNQFGQLSDASGRPMAVARLDLLLSRLSMQRLDGHWTAAPEWHAFFRADQPTRRQALPVVPPGQYKALRFTVGVAPKANHGDPNRLRPDDPLHPVVNGLHWGWKGGYVFVALEGHWKPDNGQLENAGGFSYHLGNNENTVVVELPARLTVRADSTLHLRLNASTLVSGIDVSRDGDSTHSRAQDAVVKSLKDTLPRSFSLADAPKVVSASPASPGTTTGATASPAAPSLSRAVTILRPYPLNLDARLPTVVLPADNPLTVEGVALGERLFNDRRLSIDSTVSCATCHRQSNAFSDGGRPLSAGVGGRLGQRNAMPIFNLAWVNDFFWDGRTSGLRRQALEPIVHPHEMAESLPGVLTKLKRDRSLDAQFMRAFGGPVTADRLGLALEQYMLSIVSNDSKFDRVAKGTAQFSALEKRGQELFLTEHDPANGLFGADCFHCHSGALFTNQRFANNGLRMRAGDFGRELVTKDPVDRGKFRTPSLRNVARTAPYMHDGRFRTLEEVIDHYDSGIEHSPTLDPNIAKHPRQGLRLSRADKSALAAFLRALTDPAFTPAVQVAADRAQRSSSPAR